MFISLEYGKALYENIASMIALLNYNFNLYLRNNIKLQSSTHIQLSSPRFHNFFKYGSRMDISKNDCYV